MTKTTKSFGFKIGADPEFVLTMQGRKVDARQTMELMLKNKPQLSYNENKRGFDCLKHGNIGWDGAASTGEIRPSASAEPQEVVNNMAAMFKEISKHIQICDISTISEFSSVGGHIHLEVPKGERWSTEKTTSIHRKLSSFYLPILKSENKTNLNLRIQQGYGSLKDGRLEPRFTHPDGTPGHTYELRCPSAEWLTTPKIANATLAYFGVVYHEILNHSKNFNKYNDIIYKSEKQGDALQMLSLMDYDILTDAITRQVKKYIRTFEMYPKYKAEIEYILNAKQVIKDKQKAKYNVAIGWNLINSVPEPKKTDFISSKKKIQKIAKKEDFDILKKVMNIHCNDDTNVALFAEALKDRVAAFNWKLKNNYYIFGMRKGIKDIIVKNLKNEYLTKTESIKTIMDKDTVDRLFEKMNNKFMANSSRPQSQTIDFITGKPKDLRENIITIGLPYDMRVQEDIKPFLNLIWSLEKEPMQIVKKKDVTLIDDTSLPLEQTGETYRILTKQIDIPQVVIDSDSRSLQNHQSAVNRVISSSESDF